MPLSSSDSSSWDFTPVFDLLRSPPSVPSRHSGLTPIESNTKDLPSTPIKTNPKCDSELSQSISPRLGDFGSLWELLGNSPSPTPTPIETIESQQVQATAVELSTKSQPIKILQRPSSNKKSSFSDKPAPSRPQPIPRVRSSASRDTKVGKSKVKSTVVNLTDQTNSAANEATTSDSAAEGESDSNFSVFDPPLSQKRDGFTFVPPQVGATPKKAQDESPPSSYDELEKFTPRPIVPPIIPDDGPVRVRPVAYKSATDARVGLLSKLLRQFPEYAESVTQLGRSASSTTTSHKKKSLANRPVHVFVDMSNIMVGFHDAVKAARKIPVTTRIRRLPLSFQNFSLILERGRPAAKRVLVGSDRFAAIHEGEQLGYEANILDRVHKVKTPSRRQMRFQRGRDAGSGSETNDVPAERWVEQGVDEILHLKILESLLDTDEPATIVLATGDAAEAEFSGGFMKMVERALQRSWTVELVSFSQVTSNAYKRKDFRAKWGSSFRTIMLDEYIEELLHMW